MRWITFISSFGITFLINQYTPFLGTNLPTVIITFLSFKSLPTFFSKSFLVAFTIQSSGYTPHGITAHFSSGIFLFIHSFFVASLMQIILSNLATILGIKN